MAQTREKKSVWFSPAGVAKIEALADDYGADFSKALRAILTEGFADPNVVRRARARLQRDGEVL